MIENDFNTSLTNTKEIDKETANDYQEIFVDSFCVAVDKISEDGNSEYSFVNRGETSVVLVDIDGVLITNNMVKLPVISHFVQPVIEQEVTDSFQKLVNLFEDSVIISTNRSTNEEGVFNSKEVLKVANKFVKGIDGNVPIFTNLFKQIPNLTKEDISKAYLSKEAKGEYVERALNRPREQSLLHYIGKRLSERIPNENSLDHFTLYSIEDLSIASPNRKTFLKHLAKELKKEYGIDVNIKNYVVKR